MPRDADSEKIQILSPAVTGTVHISATEGASARIALPAGTRTVRISASGAVWLAFGDSSVVAAAAASNSLLFPAGAEFFHLKDDTYTNVAALSVAGSGNQVVSATKME